MSVLSLDFETRSRVDIKKAGAHVYAAHPSTDVWCMAFAFDDEEVQLWVPGERSLEGYPVGMDRVIDHVHAGGELRAWNAQFERLIWRHILGPRYGFPVPRLEQYVDTAAEAAAMSLPRALGQAAAVLGLEQQKDDAGHRLMMQMAKPRKPTKTDPREWWDDQDRREKLYAYCMQDVRTERAVAKKLRRLSAHEREVYLLDQRINDRGVGVDLELVRAAQRMVTIGMERANQQIEELTSGAVSSVTRVADLTRWLEHRELADNVRKDTLRDLLLDDGLDPLAREVISLRAESAKSSTAKLTAMEIVAAVGRARGLLLYHGAGTGRWAGRLIQPQNFPRGTVKKAERFIDLVLAGEYDLIDIEEPVLAVVSSLLRACFVAARGTRFLSGDYSQIEARVLAWIAEQNDLVDAFAKGGKIYERMAAFIYGVPIAEVTPEQRQIGKMTILGAGYQMGWKTFQEQTRVQSGVLLTDEEAQGAIAGYREMNRSIYGFWFAIERAAIDAVREPGVVTSCGRGGKIRFVCRGDWLWCVLPSGRPLAYALPKLAPRDTPWGEKKEGLSAMGVSSKTRQWSRQHLYGGMLTENVVQAMARDIMASAMLRLERNGYPVVLTVHDEVLCEVPESHGSLEEHLRLMKVRPRWAEGLPVAADGWEGRRYRK